MNLVVRPREERDNSFVSANWLRSFRDSHMHGPLPPDLYWLVYHEAVKRLLERPAVQCLVLEDTDEEVLIGFVAHEPGWRRWSRRKRQWEEYHVVHYLYVRNALRGNGFAQQLLQATGARPERLAFSFGTVAARGVLGDSARFLPDAARYASATERSSHESSDGAVRS